MYGTANCSFLNKISKSECAKLVVESSDVLCHIKLSNICVQEWGDNLTQDDIKNIVQETTALNEVMEL